ncbi:heterokaryon incompatibility protein-domain-containing protein [Xylaria longipes]|nr:heterokaryon incompatibility protein-domain-containing protein [Xylaria longipes]
MLCEKCEKFDIQAFAKKNFPTRGYRVEDVRRAARNGCSFCALLEEHLLDGRGRQGDSSHQVLVHRRSTRSLLSPYKIMRFLSMASGSVTVLPSWIHFWVERGESANDNTLDIRILRASVSRSPLMLHEGRESIQLNVAADLSTPAAVSGDITGHLLGRHTLSEDVGKFVQDWHRECREKHADCQKTLSQFETIDAEDAPLPSRCVETVWVPEQEGSSSSASAQSTGHWAHYLRETSGEISKYIALSHRWDQHSEKAKTLRENYISRVTPGGDSSLNNENGLSPLFREVCIFAAKLGVYLVWIDSICIIQDDSADWNKEAANMANYYQRAWLTMAITSPSDSHGGLHAYPKAKDIPRVTRLPYRDRNGNEHGWFYTQCVSRRALDGEYVARVSESELLQRGWVLQEWLLSRRILSLGATTIFLQCESGMPRSPHGETLKPRDSTSADLKRANFKTEMSLNDASQTKILSIWKRVVEDYSGKQLTCCEQDRLLALSGVAREFGLALQIVSQNHRYAFSSDMAQGAKTSVQTVSRDEGVRDGGDVIELQTFSASEERDDQGWTSSVSPLGNNISQIRVRGKRIKGNPSLDRNEDEQPLLTASPVQNFEPPSAITSSTQGPEAATTAPRNQNTEGVVTDPPVQYICGLWLPFSILSQLQWEQVHPGPRGRVKGIPTWSWASIGKPSRDWNGKPSIDSVPVTWAKHSSSNQLKPRITAATTVPVDHDSWEPQFALTTTTVPDDLYSNDHRFVVLTLADAVLLPVHIHMGFESIEQLDFVAKVTNHQADVDRSGWRRVSVPSSPDVIAGWASLEDPDFQTDEQCRTGGPIYALLLDKRKVWDALAANPANNPHDWRRFFWFLGFGTMSAWAYHVLFVRVADAGGFQPFYERVGVGRLFGSGIETELESLEKTSIFLG